MTISDARQSAPLPRGQTNSFSRSLLRDEAYLFLKQRITSGTYAPATCLSERELAKRMGMSITPIKSALQKLESEGFVTVSPQRGIVVRELSLRETLDYFEMRFCLESFVYLRLAGNLESEQIEKLRVNLAEQQLRVDQGAFAQALELDAEFHMLFCHFLGNQELQREMQRVSEQMFRVLLSPYRKHQKRLRESVQEHCAIAEAVIAGQVSEAISCLERHLEWGKRNLLAPHQ